jgi:hypothetical protein
LTHGGPINWTTKVDIGGEYSTGELAKALGAGLKWSINISQSWSYTLDSASGVNTSTTYTIPLRIPAGTAVAAYQLHSNYRLFRQDGTQLSVTVPFGRDMIIFDQYPPAENSDGSKTDRIILKDLLKRAD